MNETLLYVTVLEPWCFRLFLSMDPKFGEISRPMRNRGVEIYILGEVSCT